MKRRRKNQRRERNIMLGSSVLVLTALTMTGIYVKERNQQQNDGYVVDLSQLEVEQIEEIGNDDNIPEESETVSSSKIENRDDLWEEDNFTFLPGEYDFIEDYQNKEKQKGTCFYWIPGGGHTSIALGGYTDAGKEILKQASNIEVDAVFVPCGTGTTQAGLINGLGGRIPVFGITVSRSANRCRQEIVDLLTSRNIGTDNTEICVLDNDIGYGEFSAEIMRIISELAESDGIFLDPIYNAKSFLKMTEYLKNHQEIKNAVYVNTGGQPNTFG